MEQGTHVSVPFLMYVPAAQMEHAAAPAFEKYPAAQVVHRVREENVPGLHRVQLVDPGRDTHPGAHATHAACGTTGPAPSRLVSAEAVSDTLYTATLSSFPT